MASPSSLSSSSTYYARNSTLVRYCIWTIAWLQYTSIVGFVYCDSGTSATVPAAGPIVAVTTNFPVSSAWNRSTPMDTYVPLIPPIIARRNTELSEKEEYYSSGEGFPSVLRSWNLIATPQDKQDICESNCKCWKNNTFITINCDFSANKKLNAIFGANFLIPERATSLNVKLASGTSLRIEKGFFRNSRINRLLIEGNLEEGEQVEIGSSAFNENRGPFPDIEILNCHSVILRSKAFSGELKLSIRRCNDVIIYGNAFEDTSVKGTFSEIKDLRIEEQAFNSAKAKLDIISCNLENLYRFEASLREIRFYNCTIGTVNSGTFDVISIHSIKFEECKIGSIKSRAITEKLYSEHLAITGAEIGTIESEAIFGSGINELILSKNKINNIQSNAIHVTAINAAIHKNNIKVVGDGWLHVRDWSSITILNNVFGIFGRMILEKTLSQGVICKFDGNSLTKPLPGSLNMPHPLCQIREVSIDRPCNCNTSWLEQLSARDLRSESYCTVDKKLQFCFNTTMFNVLKYINEVCDESKTTLDCIKNRNLQKINGHFFTQEELEMRDAEFPKLLFIGAGVFILILLSIVAVFTAKRFAKKRQASAVSKHNHEFSAHDRRIIDQTVDTIKNKYPHIHKQVSEAIKSLLRRDIREEKCVDIVSGIVQLLGTCESSGRDFSAFNEILLKHLDSVSSATAPPASDPIYAEPTAPIGGGYDGDEAEQTNIPPEHIYAEPGNVQQPLLRCEYASPRDRHNDMGDLYSEPINDRDSQNPPSYATTNFNQSTTPAITTSTKVQQQHPQLPSTSHNLPDVFGQSSRGALPKPLTNVQKMAQNLENSPQFSGRLPIYTEVNPSRRGTVNPSSPPFTGIIAKDSTQRRAHGMNASSSDSGSDHSGGSDVTIKIDDIEYADA